MPLQAVFVGGRKLCFIILEGAIVGRGLNYMDSKTRTPKIIVAEIWKIAFF